MRIEDVGRPDPISLEQFTAIADARYDPRDPDTVWSLRFELAALAQNSDAILRLIAESHRLRQDQDFITDQPTYFMLYECPGYALRATVWLPESARDGVRVLENGVFAYDYPHDHNFDLLTVTCFGAGYETDIYHHGEMAGRPAVGDVIEVRPLGRHRLAPGKVLMYEACRDVHVQIPVDDVTIALNFLPSSLQNLLRSQYAFEILDPRHLRIVGLPPSPEGRELSALRMLGKLAPAGFDLADRLAQVAASHPNPRVAGYADEIARLRGASAETFHQAVVQQIDVENVAFRYHEVAAPARARRAGTGGLAGPDRAPAALSDDRRVLDRA